MAAAESRGARYAAEGDILLARSQDLPAADVRGLNRTFPTAADNARLALWMVGSLLSFSAAAVSVRALAESLSVFEIMTVRSIGGLLILLALAVIRPRLWQSLAARRLGLHGLRNGIQLVSQVAWILAVPL